VSHPAPPWRCCTLADAEATRRLGRELAGLLAADSAIVLLCGDLGAGKTSLVQGLAAGLGILEPITSPTFALAQHYLPSADGACRGLVHLDLYRLEVAAAADELFAQEEEEAVARGAVLAVEWPERLSFRPATAWWVDLQLLPGDDPATGRLARLWRPATAEEGGSVVSS
jgi:tRNA threonylcarbamoyladenosine biosynthesis protein TsaE